MDWRTRLPHGVQRFPEVGSPLGRLAQQRKRPQKNRRRKPAGFSRYANAAIRTS